MMQFRRLPRCGASVTAGVAVALTTAPTAYLGALTIASLIPRRNLVVETGQQKFAILIPAHNEAAVIGRAMAALKAIDYPTDQFNVHIVADNCTDDTAQIVRAAGFDVHERIDPDDPGKGAALNWLFDIVNDQSNPPDAYVIIDADTTLEPQFLNAMNRALQGDVEAAQGFYGVRDVDGSTAAGLRYAALACRHHTRPKGRTRLGASCGLYGNGMAFRRSLLEGRRWTGHLVEDAEFQMELLLDDVLVAYVPDARVFAEMPDTLEGSSTQNRRWERGRLDLIRRYVPVLAARAANTSRRRTATLDAVADHLVPPLSVLALAQVATASGSLLAQLVAPGRATRRAAIVTTLSTLVFIGHVVVALASVRAPRSVYRSLLAAPASILWKARLWLGVLKHEDVDWVRTERNSPGGESVPDGPEHPDSAI